MERWAEMLALTARRVRARISALADMEMLGMADPREEEEDEEEDEDEDEDVE